MRKTWNFKNLGLTNLLINIIYCIIGMVDRALNDFYSLTDHHHTIKDIYLYYQIAHYSNIAIAILNFSLLIP